MTKQHLHATVHIRLLQPDAAQVAITHNGTNDITNNITHIVEIELLISLAPYIP